MFKTKTIGKNAYVAVLNFCTLFYVLVAVVLSAKTNQFLTSTVSTCRQSLVKTGFVSCTS